MSEPVVMTPEIKEFLESRMPFSPSAVVDYTPEMFLKEHEIDGVKTKILPDEFIPVFKIRSLRKDEKEALRRALLDVNKNQEAIKDVCRKCVLGWDNVFDLGTKLTYEYKADPAGGCDKEVFAYLTTSVISDICMYLSKISGLIDVDKMGL
jgi:hypothetical protein